MPIAAKDFFRGAALSLISGHPAFASLEPLDQHGGRFLVNRRIRVMLRHSKDKSPWRFALEPAELTFLNADQDKNGEAFLCLVCGRDAVVALGPADLSRVLDCDADQEQTLTLTRVPGRQARVSGPGGELGRLIAGNAFPEVIFR